MAATTMADQIVVLNGGRVDQAAAPMELNRHQFVAGFIGRPKVNLTVRSIGFRAERSRRDLLPAD